MWSHDEALKDHADGVMAGNLSPDPKARPRAYYSGSDEGFIVIDDTGAIVKQVRVGHTQSPSVAKYRPDVPGLQYMTVNFWKNPGIITLFDHDGRILAQEEPIHTGTALLPVNWRGDGQEFAMLSGNTREGGMIDGQLRRVVMFPEDGHPELARPHPGSLRQALHGAARGTERRGHPGVAVPRRPQSRDRRAAPLTRARRPRERDRPGRLRLRVD